MNANELHELLIGYAEGTLSPDRKTDVERMLLNSPELQSEVELLHSVFQELNTEVERSVPNHYFTNFLPRLRDKLEGGSVHSYWSFKKLLHMLYQPALAMLIVVSFYGLYHSFSPEVSQSSIYTLVKEFEQSEIIVAIDETSLFTANTAENIMETKLTGELFGIDPTVYQTENEVFAMLEEQDAEQVVERIQKTGNQ